MQKKFILLIVLAIVLLAFQAKVIMPLVYDVISSDLFLEDSDDEKSRISSNTLLTDAAYKQCNLHIENEITIKSPILFSERPINAFSLGNYKYVINADIEISPADGSTYTRRYVCRIQYLEGSDTAGMPDPENWSVEGLSGIDDL